MHPFRPTSGENCGFTPSRLYSPIKLDKIKVEEVKVKVEPPDYDSDSIFDAETGESIAITSSVWTSTEGRLNIDMPSILGIATEAFNIKARLLESKINSHESVQSSPILEERNNRHPLVEKFLKEGPLTPIHHKLWTPKSGLPSTQIYKAAEDDGKLFTIIMQQYNV